MNLQEILKRVQMADQMQTTAEKLAHEAEMLAGQIGDTLYDAILEEWLAGNLVWTEELWKAAVMSVASGEEFWDEIEKRGLGVQSPDPAHPEGSILTLTPEGDAADIEGFFDLMDEYRASRS